MHRRRLARAIRPRAFDRMPHGTGTLASVTLTDQPCILTVAAHSFPFGCLGLRLKSFFLSLCLLLGGIGGRLAFIVYSGSKFSQLGIERLGFEERKHHLVLLALALGIPRILPIGIAERAETNAVSDLHATSQL